MNIINSIKNEVIKILDNDPAHDFESCDESLQ